MRARRDEAVSGLVELGWTETEARVYRAALELPGATGYELARRAGLARANAYEGLARLVSRGAVVRLADRPAARYRAVPFDELAPALVSRFSEAAERVRRLVAACRTDAAEDGRIALVAHRDEARELAQGLAAAAARELCLAQSNEDARHVAPFAERALDQGARVVTVCLDGCAAPCGACVGQVRRPGAGALRPRSLFVARDGQVALVVAPSGEGVYARDPALVAWWRAAFLATAGEPMTAANGNGGG